MVTEVDLMADGATPLPQTPDQLSNWEILSTGQAPAPQLIPSPPNIHTRKNTFPFF